MPHSFFCGWQLRPVSNQRYREFHTGDRGDWASDQRPGPRATITELNVLITLYMAQNADDLLQPASRYYV